MPTAHDLIKTAANKLGVRSDEVTAQDADDGLSVLNSMLDAFQTQRLFVYQIEQQNFSWPASTSSRTIGSSGNFNTTWPTKIEDGTFFKDSGGNDYEVPVTHDRELYDRIRLKTSTGSYPEILFYDRAYPLGTLNVWPVPSSVLTLYLNSWQQLQSFAALTTSLSLPPGYQAMIEFNLAEWLESVFRVPAPDSVKKWAEKLRGYLASQNEPTLYMETDIASVLDQIPRSHDIYADR